MFVLCPLRCLSCLICELYVHTLSVSYSVSAHVYVCVPLFMHLLLRQAVVVLQHVVLFLLDVLEEYLFRVQHIDPLIIIADTMLCLFCSNLKHMQNGPFLPSYTLQHM